jgi:hypothetical protein
MITVVVYNVYKSEVEHIEGFVSHEWKDDGSGEEVAHITFKEKSNIPLWMQEYIES